MFLLADWLELITNEKGKLLVQGTVEALSGYRAWPLLRILPFRNVAGAAYIANRAGASAEAATRVLGSDFTESAPTVNPYTFPMRAAGGDIKIDRVMVDADTSGVAKAGIKTQKIIDIGARLNRMFFKGDADAGSGKEWTGVDVFCDDEDRYVEAGADGDVITAALMDEAIGKTPGANFIACNNTLANQINALEQGAQKMIILNNGQPQRAFFNLNYKGIPIVPVLQAPNDETATLEEILDFDETQGDSNVASRVTVGRAGFDGIFGIQNKMLELLPEEQRGAFIYQHISWLMAGLATDYTDALFQVKGVLSA